jgi:alginate O-acetyltransferase complex protein AlgI
MWLMAAAIFFSCKWITFWRVKPQLGHISPARVLSYFFLWAGLDAAGFLGPRRTRPEKSDAVKMLSKALFKTVLGTLILFGCARLSPNPLVTGWIGMAGMVLLLHFGLFDIASVIWRLTGVNASPIMNSPIVSTSLGEFWGRRWNSAFNHLVIVLFFRDFARRFGAIRGTLTAFLISGLIHELVISLPAGGGYGLPTGYFLLQGWAVLAQRTIPARLGLRDGFNGWLFTMFFTGVPAFWLFHPLFVRHVILPFMQAIGAL